VPPMKMKWLKWTLISIGVIVSLTLIAIVCVVVKFGGDDKTYVIRQSKSNDGNVIAEVISIVTPVHGGPDRVQVTLRPKTEPFGGIVYSQAFECGPDFRAFQVRWLSPSDLLIQYGLCEGRYFSARDNKIFLKSTAWQGIHITYRQSDYISHGEP
jgi:hypothetical protein